MGGSKGRPNGVEENEPCRNRSDTEPVAWDNSFSDQPDLSSTLHTCAPHKTNRPMFFLSRPPRAIHAMIPYNCVELAAYNLRSFVLEKHKNTKFTTTFVQTTPRLSVLPVPSPAG